MKTKLTKLLVVLMSALLLFTSLPQNIVSAEEENVETVEVSESEEIISSDEEIPVTEEEDTQTQGIKQLESDDLKEFYGTSTTVVYVNPDHEDFGESGETLVSASDIDVEQYLLTADDSTATFSTTDAAAKYLADGVTAHQETITFRYYFNAERNADLTPAMTAILNEINGKYHPLMNDYAAHNHGKVSGSMSITGGEYLNQTTITWQALIIYTAEYRTTIAQENELNQLLTTQLNQLNLYNASDYEKVKGVYDWVTANITYDNEAIKPTHDENDGTPWTAWKALRHRTAVCQGYALLMYRMLDALGVEVYYAYGEADGGGPGPGRHAWNVVNLYGNYYLLDSTWDASRKKRNLPYEYFLKGTTDFYVDHTPDSDDRNNRYTVSTTDYDPSYVPPATVAVTGVNLAPANKKLYVDETLQLTATVFPADATNKKVTYKSSNATVASVDSFGLVTAKKAGTAVITVTTADGSYTAQSTITVENEEVFIPVTKITASKTTYEIDLSDTNRYKIDVTVEPENATVKDLVYTSSDESVATVDGNGYITAHKKGTAKISIYPVSNGYTQDNPASKINVNVIVTSDQYEVRLHMLDGTLNIDGSDFNEYTFTVNKNSYNYKYLNPVSNTEGKGFEGWYLDADLTNKFDGSMVNQSGPYIYERYITEDIDLYAKYEDMVTVTFDFNGGYYDDPYSDSVKYTLEYQTVKGTTLKQTPYDSYFRNDNDVAFDVWVDGDGNEVSSIYNYVFSTDTVMIARWSECWDVTVIVNELGYYGYENSQYIREKVFKVAKGKTLDESGRPNVLGEYVDGYYVEYVFDAFYYDQEYTRRISDNLWSFRPTADITIYARAAEKVTVTFDANGGYLYNDPAYLITEVARPSGVIFGWGNSPKAMKDGKAFVGWSLSKTSTSVIDLNTTAFTENTTLYAVYQSGVKVVLNAGSGTFYGGDSVKTFYLAEGKTINDVYNGIYDPSKPNAKMLGWYSKANFSEDSYFSQDVYRTKFTKETTLYAKYGDTVAFTFDANGGYFNSNPSQKTNTVEVVKDEYFDSWIREPVRKGKVFAGWYDNPQCTGEQELFTEYYVSEAKTYYAKWADAATVTVHGNGGTRSYDGSTTYSQILQAGTYFEVFGNMDTMFTRAGYKYTGLYYDEECTQKVNRSRLQVMNDLDLYIGWTNNVYTLTFDLNGGTWQDVSSITVLPGDTIGYYWSQPVKDNYAFDGWLSSLTGRKITNIDGYAPAGNETLTAQWTEDFYTVTVHSSMGGLYRNGSYYNELVYHARKGSSIDVYSPSVSNYRFEGWYTDANLKNFYKNDLTNYTPDKDIHLYAKMSVQQRYTVTIKMNGGYYLYGNKKIYSDYVTTTTGEYINKPVIRYKDNTKAFKGLSLSSSGSIIPDDYKITKDTTLYAIYDSNVYHINADFNGGYTNNNSRKSSEEYTIVKGNTLSELSSVSLKHPQGYLLAGFTTVKNDPSTKVESLWNYVPAGNMTLYALWVEDYYYINFVADGGTLSTSAKRPVTLRPGDSFFLSSYYYYATPDNSAKRFVGWYDNPEFTGEAYSGELNITSDLTLYAKFDVNLSVTFDGNGRTFANGRDSVIIYLNNPDDSSINIKTSAPAIADTDKTYFKGWNTKKDGSGTSYSDYVDVYSNMTLYAQWNIPTVDVEKIKINEKQTNYLRRIKVGQNYQLSATIVPDNATYQDVVWSSSNSSVATVDSNGLVKGLKAGKTVITAKTAYGNISDSMDIVVDEDDGVFRPTSIFVYTDSAIYVNETVKVSCNIDPSTAEAEIRWSVADKSIATITQDGMLTAIKEGETYVTAETTDGYLKDTQMIRVIKRNDVIPKHPNIIIDGVVYNNITAYLHIGQTINLKATDDYNVPMDNSELVWRVDDESIATIDDNGNLTGVSEGYVQVYAYHKYSKEYTGLGFRVINGNDIDATYYAYGTNNDYYTGSYRTQLVNQTKAYDIYFSPYEAKDEYKVIEIDQAYLDANECLDVNVSYVYEYNTQLLVEDKMTYVEVTSSAPGTYDIPFRYGKDLKNKGSLYIHVINAEDAIQVTYDARGGKVKRQSFCYSNFEDRGQEVATLIYKKDQLGEGLRYVELMSAVNDNGNAFVGWYLDINDESSRLELNYEVHNEAQSPRIVGVTENITLYAKWDDAYTTVFDANGGMIATAGSSVYRDSLEVQTVKGQPITYSASTMAIEKPHKSGYNFTGWYADKECTKYVGGGKLAYHSDDYFDIFELVPTSNETYYAGWVKTFAFVLEPNGGKLYNRTDKYSRTLDPYIVIDLTQAQYVPEYEGKVFVGWYYDKALTRPVEEPQNFTATAETILYAKYVNEYYTVTYDLGEGITYLDSDNYGSVVKRKIGRGYPIGIFPATISYADASKKFNDKWYLDATRTQEIDVEEYVPTADMTIYAGYSDMVTVTFDLNGGYYGNNTGNTTYDHYVESGSRIAFPYSINNVNNDMAFEGWYKEKTFVNKVDLNTFRPVQNTTLYAKWNANKVVVTFNANGGVFDNNETVKQLKIIKNSTLAEIDKPTFVLESVDLTTEMNTVSIENWAFDAEGKNLVEDTYSFTNDVTLYAVWPKTVNVMGVELIDIPVSVAFGETYQMLAQVLPVDATNKKVTWSVDNSDIAVVTFEGKLIPKNIGTVVVTVTTDEGKYSDSATIEIIDNAVRVTSIELARTSVDIGIGETYKNNVTVHPENATDKTLRWRTSDEDIVSVDENGNITGNKAGTATVTVTSADGNVSAEFTVNVHDTYVDLDKLVLAEKNIRLNPGDKKTLSYTLTPENATNRNVTWSSSDWNVATVDQNGTVTAVAEGTAYVYAIATGSDPMTYPLVGDYCVVTVGPEVKINTLSINTAEKNMVVGDKDTLTVTILPEAANDKKVIWSSSDEEVVIVDENGNIEAIGEGVATITVSNEEGDVSDECVITVSAVKVMIESIKLDADNLKITIPESKKLNVTIMPEDATNKELSWSSSDESVAIVNDSGNVTAVGEGSATITVTTTDGSEFSAQCTVVVEEPTEEVKIVFDKPEVTVTVNGGTATITPIITPESYAENGVEYIYDENSEYFDFNETTGVITGKKATVGTVETIKAKIRGYDISGVEEQLADAEQALKDALENTRIIKSQLDTEEQNKTTAEVNYQNALDDTASSQKYLDDANDQLKAATASRDAAQKEYDDREAALEDARTKLEEARENGGDAATALEEAQRAKDEAQARYDAAQEQIAKGSVGFFEDNGNEAAVAVIEDRIATQSKDKWGKTQVGKKHDATSLENMKEAIRLMKIGNKHRENDDNFDAKALRVDDILMAVAQIQTNASKVEVAHSQIYSVWENLAWGHNDPYAGWYTEEKKVYDYAKTNGLSEAEAVNQMRSKGLLTLNVPGYGHYTNLVNPGLTYTGLAVVTDSSVAYNGKCQGQTFYYTQISDKGYSVDEYEKLFNDYCDRVNKELTESKKALDEAVKILEELQKGGNIGSATTSLISAAEERVTEAEKALQDAEKALQEAEAEVTKKQSYVNKKEEELQEARDAEASALEARNTALAQYNLILDQYNQAKEAEAVAQAAYDKIKATIDGFIAVCEIRVIQPVTGLSFKDSEEPRELQSEQKFNLKELAVFEPEDATVRDLTWTSSDETVATVDENGVVTGVATGEVVITATTTDGTNISASATFNVIPNGAYGDILPEDCPASIKDIPEGLWLAGVKKEVEFDPEVKAYTQSFRVYDHNVLLKEGTDYTVSYSKNNKVGTASITVKGKGNYTGTLVYEFDIVRHDLNTSDAIIVLKKETLIYNGKPQKATISSIEYKGVKLKNNTDYKATYENEQSTDEGAYTINIELVGNYEGTLTATYHIVKNKISMSNSSVSGVKNLPYTGSEITQDITVKNSGKTLVEGVDYTVEYLNNVNAGTAYVIVNGMGEYAGTYTKTFKISALALNAKSVEVQGLPENVDYYGSPVTYPTQLFYNGKELIEGIDYTVAYKNNDKAGTATVTFKGIGNYSGSLSKTFKINKLEITADMFSVEEEFEYVKGGVKPAVESDLMFNKDYSVSYKNNTKTTEQNKGVRAVITIKGKGNYTGTVTKEFTIVPKDISEVTVVVADKVYTGKANAWKSNVSLVDSDGKKLAAGTDYNKNVRYEWNGRELDKTDIVPAGEYVTVIIDTDGLKVNNYTGTVSGTYRIVRGDISKASVKINAQVYTGKEIEVTKDDITVKIGGIELRDEDYDIVAGSYLNNINKGSASVTLVGKGEYGGNKVFKFNIVQRNICQIIRFHANGEGVTGTMKDQYIYKSSKLSRNTFKRPGYVFKGWVTASGEKYGDNDEISYSILKAGIVTDLYAVWE